MMSSRWRPSDVVGESGRERGWRGRGRSEGVDGSGAITTAAGDPSESIQPQPEERIISPVMLICDVV